MDAQARVKLSKGLSSALRHRASQMKLAVSPDGYVAVEELLRHQKFKAYSVENLRFVVEQDEKQRFSLRENGATGALEIRANQGHSITGVVDQELLQPISSWDSSSERCIHGTYYRAWETIRTDGLRPMGRNHIHFAPGYFGDPQVVSGMRKNCTVFITLDVDACLREGIPL
eukprot:CAMPEP_0185852730 /NCGR_PEP_ID=MMETSP1354-20130828/16017_1 /TAXON_ID=708628 /ORGANISM="Erythrolobus madagascarensis, Strain CCMP3276" /LENGTH=171 /DNA_ID=CAMNT_0028554059 /DNA_START=66 /DNA_END=577 /DNA_ORIENTATION=+